MNFKSHFNYYKRAGLYKYTIVISLIITTSIILSNVFESWEHISRCGGIITVFGACLLSRDLIRKGPYNLSKPKEPISKSIPNSNLNLVNMAGISDVIEEVQDNYAKYIGFYILVLGTILWSYGDWILNCILPFNT